MSSPHSDSDTDSNRSQPGSEAVRRHSDLSDSIFKSYFESTGRSTATAADLSKILSFLTSSSFGALSCLICLERIRRADPTWSCTSVCFSVFHLFCIQSWARQASDVSALHASTRLPISSAKAAELSLWNCPKCRIEYPKTLIPKSYLCFAVALPLFTYSAITCRSSTTVTADCAVCLSKFKSSDELRLLPPTASSASR